MNYKVFGCDTDSIIFSKKDNTEINEQDRKLILDKINSLFPKRIKFEDDGYYHTVITFKAKNYVLYDGKKIKTKGSALKDQKKEIALKEFQSSIIESIVFGRDNYKEIYDNYIKEILNIKAISRWASKKTISEKVLSSERTNESKIRDAIVNTEYQPGDRCYMFFKNDESLCLVEEFSGDYHIDKLLKKLWNSSQLFKAVLPTDQLFAKYHLKKNKEHLNNLNNASLFDLLK